MSGLVVFAAAVGLLVTFVVFYLVLGVAADSRTADEQRRRQQAVDAFAAVLFAEDGERLDAARVRRSVERDTLVEVVSSLPAELGTEGRERLAGVLATPRTERTFGWLLNSRRWQKRVDAARLCGLMGDDADRQRLLTDPHWAVRIVAMGAMTPRQIADQADLVAALLLDPDHAVRMVAADTLPRAGTDATMPLNALLEQTGEDRAAALTCAGRMTDRLLIGALIRHARSDHASSRVLAATALAQQSPLEVEPILLELLHDPEPTVRITAAEGLGRIGSAAVLLPLRQLLSDTNWQVRQAAERALGAAGPAGGLLVRQNRTRRAELPVIGAESPAVPRPVARNERTPA